MPKLLRIAMAQMGVGLLSQSRRQRTPKRPKTMGAGRASKSEGKSQYLFLYLYRECSKTTVFWTDQSVDGLSVPKFVIGLLRSVIYTILDAIEIVLKELGEPLSPFWLAFQLNEQKLWKASEHDVRAALEKDKEEGREKTQFVKLADDEWGLRSWDES